MWSRVVPGLANHAPISKLLRNFPEAIATERAVSVPHVEWMKTRDHRSNHGESEFPDIRRCQINDQHAVMHGLHLLDKNFQIPFRVASGQVRDCRRS